MAFTSAQLVKLRAYLGYPNVNRFRNTRLEAALAIVGADADAQSEAETYMDAVEALEGLLSADGSIIQSAGLKRAEDVEWYALVTQGGMISAPMAVVKARAKMHIGRLSTLFGVPILADYFGPDGYPGDEFMGRANQIGGVFPLG